MLECMQSLGRRSVETITDYEYEFYNKYLSKYADGDISNPFIKAEPSDQIVFSNLKNLYSIAKAVPSNQRNMTDELSDSFAFYVAAGVISLDEKKCNYYINLDELSKFKEQYEKATEPKGISYSKKVK